MSDSPTAADYAWHEASEARRKSESLERRVAKLEAEIRSLKATIDYLTGCME